MKSNDPFEEHLRRQPLQSIPPAWREEILRAASDAAKPAGPEVSPWRERVWHRLREVLWPAPQAWAALATLWLVMLIVNRIVAPPAGVGPAPAPPALAAGSSLMLSSHPEALLAEWGVPSNTPETADPKSPPLGPRSDLARWRSPA